MNLATITPAASVPHGEVAVRTERLSLRGRLNEIDLVHESGALALIGPNGAGKSTLLNVLVGRLKPDSGSARVFGLAPRQPAVAAQRAYVPQRIAFPPHIQVAEVMHAAAQAKGCDPALIEAAAGRMGLLEFMRQRAGTLSGGMTQRLALAAALMDEPALWLLDEPASALDGGGLERLAAWVGEHVAAGGSALVSAHRPEEVEAFASHALLLRSGEVLGHVRVQGLFEYRLQDEAGAVQPFPAGWRVKRNASAELRRALGGEDDGRTS